MFPNLVNHQNVGTNSAPNFPPETKGTFLQRRHILQSKLSEDLGLTIFGRHLVFTPLLTNILLVPPLSLLIPIFFRGYHIFGQCILDNHGERTIRIEWTLCRSQDVRRGERQGRQFNRVSYISIFLWNTYFLWYSGWRPERAHDLQDGRPHDCRPSSLLLRHLLNHLDWMSAWWLDDWQIPGFQ